MSLYPNSTPHVLRYFRIRSLGNIYYKWNHMYILIHILYTPYVHCFPMCYSDMPYNCPLFLHNHADKFHTRLRRSVVFRPDKSHIGDSPHIRSDMCLSKTYIRLPRVQMFLFRYKGYKHHLHHMYLPGNSYMIPLLPRLFRPDILYKNQQHLHIPHHRYIRCRYDENCWDSSHIRDF